MKRAATGPVTRSRSRRIVIEQYEQETCRLDNGIYGAAVFKARHRVTGNTVAIKHVFPGCGDHEEKVTREARFVESCGGIPSIVGYHGVVREPDTNRLCIVTEYVGPTIECFFPWPAGDRRPLFPEPTLCAVMWQLLTACAEMHGRGIIHRHIKPKNILIAEDDSVVKICDFGIATSTSDMPKDEVHPGPWYTAPEILLGMTDYDGRVDTWSLGCVMAAMVNGSTVFDGYCSDANLYAIFYVLGVPNDETWPGFSSTLFATAVLPKLVVPKHSWLRELLPEATLSEKGFEVLSGLLTCNPENRLTAAAALKLPWFTDVDATELKKVASMLPEKVENNPLKIVRRKRRKLWRV